jgi:hypothetical protein
MDRVKNWPALLAEKIKRDMSSREVPLTEAELSALTDVPIEEITRMLRAEGDHSFASVMKVAEFLSLDLNALCKGKEQCKQQKPKPPYGSVKNLGALER